MRERMLAMEAIWTNDEVSFDGEFYRIPRSRIEPKPMQTPHPPLLVGGYSTRILRRVAELGDGYLAGNVPFERAARLIDELSTAADAGSTGSTFVPQTSPFFTRSCSPLCSSS